ncbi:methyltransferase domain-containing protein [Aromatoleum evansii]|uniref:Methyltransferase domain-containing protein n=1 Tax=Aromatoleum evansii TaxID=59406 RepID=A0ABZ1AT14_AROEV|nr:methyltransferase domain-containing protein [Aromatoleum evansii]
MVAIAGLRKEQIFEAVQQMYTDVANQPQRRFHFPTGRAACLFVGYPESWLERVPDTAQESFAGVGFPFAADVIRRGNRVLDVGSGSGTDTLIAAGLVGTDGRVLALDMTQAMIDKLRANATLAGAGNVEPIEGNAEAIPIPDACVDVVTSNGVLNLVPDKPRAFAELHRVLRPGGWVQLADIVVSQPIGEKSRSNPRLWAECVVGAVIEEAYLDAFHQAGFDEIRILRRFDYFSGSSSEDTRRIAAALGAHALELVLRKPRAG